MYWDIDEVLRYQRLFNWVIGFRGAGKTYGCKKKFLKFFLERGEQFVYMRRYKTEFNKNHIFWNDIIRNNEFPDHKLEVSGSTYKVDGLTCGFSSILSTSKIEKGVAAYPDVRNIVFDEFILDKGVHHYLPDEVTLFLEALTTIIRQKSNMRIFCLSNAISITNPYFLTLNLDVPRNGIYTNKFHLVQTLDFESLRGKENMTDWEQFVDTTDYGRYSMDNEFLRDNYDFIERKEKSRCIFTVTYNDKTFGIWESTKRHKMWVSYDVDPSIRYNYSFGIGSHKPSTVLIKNASQNGNFKAFLDYFKNDMVRFEDINIKNIFYQIIAKTY